MGRPTGTTPSRPDDGSDAVPVSGEPNWHEPRREEMGPSTSAAALASASRARTASERWASVTRVAMDDADLASRFASGDADMVRVVYQTYGRLVFSIAYKVLGDTGLAEDATQQTFVQAWRAARTYDPSRPLGAWLTTIAKRVSIDVYRREKRHRNLENVDTAVSSTLVTLPPSAEQIHDVEEVRRALDELSAADRELIRMQHFDELSHAEIARELRIPLGTVKSRTFRAHRRLAVALAHLRTQTDEGGSDVRR